MEVDCGGVLGVLQTVPIQSGEEPARGRDSGTSPSLHPPTGATQQA